MLKIKKEYEIAWIINSKYDKRWKNMLLYKCIWLGYEHTSHSFDWLPPNELGHAQELIDDFHSEYPGKAGPGPPPPDY